MKVRSFILIFTMMITTVALEAQAAAPDPKPTATDSKPATTDTLRQLEADFMKAAAERGSEGYMSFYAEDAIEVPNGSEAIHGKANIAKTMDFLNDKNNQLTWTPVDAGISLSGDLGYTSGKYEFRSKDKDGKVKIEHGKYTSIWKKQPDGNWKVVLDMGNASGEK
jgi:ketosteroid isomerase-like protein